MAGKNVEKANQTLSCSFCGKSQKEVKKLIAGPTVYICDECIGLCNDIIAEEIERGRAVRRLKLRIPSRRRSRPILDEYVIGQDRAKKILAVAVHNHYKRIDSQASRCDDVELAEVATSCCSAPPAAARRSSRRRSRASSTSPSPSPTPPTSPRPATSARTSRTSSSTCCRTPTTTSSGRSAASSTSTRSTRSPARATTPPSPATSRARACSRRCSRSSRAPSPTCRPRAAASTRSRSSCRSTPPTSSSSAAARSSASSRSSSGASGSRALGFGADIKSKKERKLGELLAAGRSPRTCSSSGMIPEFIGRLPVVATLHELDEDGAGRHPHASRRTRW